MSKPEYNREFIYTIPESIFLDATLTLTDMKVYMFIRSFMDAHRECFASNRWFAEKLGVDPRTIRASITKLENKFYIERQEVNRTRVLVTKRNPLTMSDADLDCTPDLFCRGGDLNTLGGGSKHPGGEDLNVHLSTIVVKEKDQKLLLPSRAQILNTPPHSEPVVVSFTSLTSTPKPQVTRYAQSTTDKLLAAYRATPIQKGNIMCEGDFLSAAYFSIDIRDKTTTTEQQRVSGICKFVRDGSFDEPSDWALNLKRVRDRESGQANATLQEIESAKKAVLDPEIKGRDDALAKIAELGIKFKKETTIEPVYKESTFEKNKALTRKAYKKLELPQQNDIMFQPDMSLLKMEDVPVCSED